jgi:hypothetical protein
MSAVATLNLLPLLESRSSGGFHGVYVHHRDVGFCIYVERLHQLNTTDITPPFPNL